VSFSLDRTALAAAFIVAAMVCLVWSPPAMAAPGDLTLVSASDIGVKGDAVSDLPSVSADGQWVAFASVADNLDPADSDSIADVYVKSLRTGDIKLASTSDTQVKGNLESSNPSISGDGRFVAFESWATNLDPADDDVFLDVYVKDLLTGELTLASTSSAGVKGDFDSLSPSITLDGLLVAFMSVSDNLDPSDPDRSGDVYAKDLTTGETKLVSTSTTGAKGNGSSEITSQAVSGDGTKVAFMSVSDNLDPSDPDGIPDVFVKDLITGELTLASTSVFGEKGNAVSTRASISADGRVVAFESAATTLDPRDQDAFADVYAKDLQNGLVSLVSTTDDGEKGDLVSFSASISSAGTAVAFVSLASNLDPGDTDRIPDIYVKDLGTLNIELASISSTGVKANLDSGSPALQGSLVAFGSAATNLDPADTDLIDDVYVKELGETENAPPVATDDTYDATSNGILMVDAPGVLGNDTDADGDPLVPILVDGPGHGSVSFANDGSLAYEADLGFTGTDSFTYVASDGPADSNVATVTIRVNTRPVATNDAYSTDQGVILFVPGPGVLGNDTDGDGGDLSAVLVTPPARGGVELVADGSFGYVPGNGFSGTDSFAYVANDGVEDSEVAFVTITVNPPPSCMGLCLSIDGVSVTEGNKGTTKAQFTVRLSQAPPANATITVMVATADDSAISTSDYNALSQLITFRKGRTTATFGVAIRGDRTPEPTETYFVLLSMPVGAGISDGQGIGTIVNDD
jgi:Tol biopolymer transport system component